MKLYIIGNGFDLYHYLPSSYKDFHDFVKERDHDLFEIIEKYFDNDGTFWYAFEMKLRELDEFMLIRDVLRSLGHGGWDAVDIESYEPTIQYYTIHTYYQLKKYMVDWVRSLNQLPLRRKYPDIEADSLFISFNYTNTLERHYRIHPSRINYIHGDGQEDNCDLIFGHDMHDEDLYSEFDENQEGQGRLIVQSFLKQSQKPVERILEDNQDFWNKLSSIREVIVIGHSLSAVDAPYFNMIDVYVSKGCLWKVSYYDEADAENHVKALVQCGINSRLIQSFDILPDRPK